MIGAAVAGAGADAKASYCDPDGGGQVDTWSAHPLEQDGGTDAVDLS